MENKIPPDQPPASTPENIQPLKTVGRFRAASRMVLKLLRRNQNQPDAPGAMVAAPMVSTPAEIDDNIAAPAQSPALGNTTPETANESPINGAQANENKASDTSASTTKATPEDRTIIVTQTWKSKFLIYSNTSGQKIAEPASYGNRRKAIR